MTEDDSSALSSPPSEDGLELQLTKKDGILKFLSTAPREISPPRPKRDASPPHEYVLADNTDIAFIVMFRSRFTEAFPRSLANFGPQELERDVVDIVPREHVEHFLCALLGLLLNRKQDIKPGHYNRALEEAIQTHKSQWAKDWESKNPLSGGATFGSMSPTQRLTLLRTLILWSLSSSDIVKGIITTSYKQNRHEDDLNQPLSVQPWGSDANKRRYFLIEGLDDTHFRVYRESNYTRLKRTWWSVASDIDELKQLAHKLETEDRGQKARLLSGKMLGAIPRFEATEEKRKRREYRQARKQQFKRPEPNLSLYEGRTRGKRIKYTYSDEDEDYGYSDATTSRRSARNTGTHTPAEGLAPTVTLSGRQVRARQGGAYGESILSGAQTPAVTLGGTDGTSEEPENGENAGSRPRRGAAASRGVNSRGQKGAHIEGYNSVDEMDSDEDDASEQDYGDDEEEGHVSLESDVDDQDDLTDEEDELSDDVKKTLVVKLPVKTPTPERKVNSQSHLTPEKEPLRPINLLPTVKNDQSQGGSAGDTAQRSSFAATSTAPSLLAGSSAEPNGAPTKSSLDSSPLSPLALRGSPEKPHTFSPSIDVGYGGP